MTRKPCTRDRLSGIQTSEPSNLGSAKSSKNDSRPVVVGAVHGRLGWQPRSWTSPSDSDNHRQMVRARAILWLFSLLALITAGSISVAEAHGSYGQHVHTHHHHQQTSESTAAYHSVNSEAPMMGISAHAVTSSSDFPPADAGCDNRGCCTAGHCATCVAAIAPADSKDWLATQRAHFGWYRAPAIADATLFALKRPPRS
jgi:hypothetical protein